MYDLNNDSDYMTSNLMNFESESENEVAQSCPTLRPRGL